MASIKDVAKKAGVSISTVSIIINGKSEERKISEETQNKVLLAMKELQYQPNLSAKKLRSSQSQKTIALFWTTDFREVMLARFLSGLQNKIKELQLQYDIVIYPYQNNHLHEENVLKSLSHFHGAIIANASQEDILFLKTINPMVPIVLYNREISNYSSVSVEDEIIAKNAFELLSHKNSIAMIKAPYVFDGMKIRDDTLIQLLKENHQNVLEYEVASNDSKSGLEIAKNIDFQKVDVIFTASDMLALGIMHYCFMNHIDIPEDVQILSIGNGLVSIDEYLNPSLSTIQIPMEDMAGECINIMNDLFRGSSHIQKKIEPMIQLRDSFQ